VNGPSHSSACRYTSVPVYLSDFFGGKIFPPKLPLQFYSFNRLLTVFLTAVSTDYFSLFQHLVNISFSYICSSFRCHHMFCSSYIHNNTHINTLITATGIVSTTSFCTSTVSAEQQHPTQSRQHLCKTQQLASCQACPKNARTCGLPHLVRCRENSAALSSRHHTAVSLSTFLYSSLQPSCTVHLQHSLILPDLF
jgi:hypothetical protein